MPKLFISYDIGGAEIAHSYYMVNFPDEAAFFVCDGPALKYFEQQCVDTVVIGKSDNFRKDLRDFIAKKKITEAYCSTGATTYELDAMKELKTNDIKTYAFVEHWTNYRERFGYPHEDWKSNLPEHVLFFDDQAVSLANQLGFPEDRIVLEKNPRQILLKDRYDNYLSEKKHANDQFRILYLSDPLENAAVRLYGNKSGFGFDEITVFHDIREQVFGLRFPRLCLTIRRHPIEPVDKYSSMVSSNVSVSDHADIVEDLAEADMTIGCFSSALATAAVLGRPSYSYIPEHSLGLISEGMDLSHVEGLYLLKTKDELTKEISLLYHKKFPKPNRAV